MITNYRTTVEYHTWNLGLVAEPALTDAKPHSRTREKPSVHWLSRRVEVWSFLTPAPASGVASATWKSRWPSYLISKLKSSIHRPRLRFTSTATPTLTTGTHAGRAELAGASVCTPHRERKPLMGLNPGLWPWTLHLGFVRFSRQQETGSTPLPSLTGGHEGTGEGGSSQEELRRRPAVTLPMLGTQARMVEEGGIIDREWRTVKRLNSIAWILEEWGDLGKGNKRMAEEGSAVRNSGTVLKKKQPCL